MAILAIGAMAAASAATAQGAKLLAKSNFTNGTENWKVVGDTAGAREDPDHVATGGVPGAFVQIEDAAVGGVMYWRAPAEFRGNKEAAYRGSLVFVLTQSANSDQFDDDDVVLTGSGLRLVFDLASNPELFPTWTLYDVPLVKDGWTDATNAAPATGKDLRKVLGDLSKLEIRAEYETGDDTDGLDTVRLVKP